MAESGSSDAFKRNLVIVHSPGAQELSDWIVVKELINARAPDIEVRIVNNGEPHPEITEWQLSRPSLVFSACNLSKFQPAGGKVYAGGYVDKLMQIRQLADAGIPTPRTMLLSPGLSLDPAVWGEYVVVKPSSKLGSSYGRGVTLARSESVGDRFVELTGNGRLRMIVQKLIDATDAFDRLYAYRVLTMFGRPLYASTTTQVQRRPPLAEIHDQGTSVIANNAWIKGLKQELALVEDADVLQLAARAADATGQYPVLGLDIIRERSTGDLYVLETNSGGNVWHLSSKNALSQREKERQKKYKQFGALNIAAETLIERTRREASLFLV
jgi:hypothetical protein